MGGKNEYKKHELIPGPYVDVKSVDCTVDGQVALDSMRVSEKGDQV